MAHALRADAFLSSCMSPTTESAPNFNLIAVHGGAGYRAKNLERDLRKSLKLYVVASTSVSGSAS